MVSPAVMLPHGLERQWCTCDQHRPSPCTVTEVLVGPNPFVDEDHDYLVVSSGGQTVPAPKPSVPEQPMNVQVTFHQLAREYYHMVHRQPAPGCVTTRALLLGY